MQNEQRQKGQMTTGKKGTLSKNDIKRTERCKRQENQIGQISVKSQKWDNRERNETDMATDTRLIDGLIFLQDPEVNREGVPLMAFKGPSSNEHAFCPVNHGKTVRSLCEPT